MTAYSINIPFNPILPNRNTFVLVFEIKKEGIMENFPMSVAPMSR